MSKLRTYDNKALANNYVLSTQIIQKVTELMIEAEIDDASKLPSSMISTEELYTMAVCSIVMYEALEEQSLISNAHIKQSKTIH